MSNKVYKRVNKYNIGSWLEKNAGGVASALGGAATLASDIQGALAGNQEAINNTKAGINQVNNTAFNAGNTSSLMSQWGAANYMDPVTSKQLRSDKGALGVLSGAATGLSAGAALGPVGAIGGAIAGIGSGIASWFGGKSRARRRARKFNEQIAQANNRLDRNFETAVDNLEEQQLNNALMNYAAYGGLLDMNNEYKSGGNIYIKPSKRGTFTEAAKKRGMGVQEFASKVLANKEDYSTAMIKKANFAKNAAKWHANGGPLESNGIIWPSDLMFINNGDTHENNPNEGVQIGVDSQGIPNLVEEGEVVYGDYVFSNRLKVPKKDRKEFKLGNKDISFADAVEKFAEESKERPNDPISKLGLETNLNKLIVSQEGVRNKQSKLNIDYGNMFAIGGPRDENYTPLTVPTSASKVDLPSKVTSPFEVSNIAKSTMDSAFNDFLKDKINNNKNNKFNWQSLLRYAPVLGNAIGLLDNKTNYANANAAANAIDNANVNVSPTYLGDYLVYNPFDINYAANKLNAQAAANRRAINNTNYGNRSMANAALLAADLNAQTALGDAYRQAAEYNQGLRERVATFNRGTNQYNSQVGLQADMFNAETKRALLGAKMQELAMRESERNRYEDAKSANITSLFDNLGAIGKEQTMIDMFNNNPYLLYEVLTGKYKAACGGKIKRRRK